jgi:predicted nucleic acid-binding Zn ribbon protein
MAEKLLQHKHCINCGLAIKSDKEYCSDECKKERKEMLKKKRRQLLTLYIGSVIVVIILVLISMGAS